MLRDAYIVDKTFRYWLSRIWDDSLPTVTFIGLNPSTADAKDDDKTVTTCIAYAKRWGNGGLFIANLFAFIDTHQTKIWNEPDPIGPENDAWLENLAAKSSLVIAAWGNDGRRLDRSAVVCRLLPRLHCLKVNKSGEAHHPLYLSPDIKPKPYRR
jgi:hypothetical protein